MGTLQPVPQKPWIMKDLTRCNQTLLHPADVRADLASIGFFPCSQSCDSKDHVVVWKVFVLLFLGCNDPNATVPCRLSTKTLATVGHSEVQWERLAFGLSGWGKRRWREKGLC